MDRNRYIGARIKQARQEKDWTQDVLGKRYGCSGPHIARIEKGKVEVKLSGIEKFAKIFGVSASYFLPPEEKKTSPDDLVDGLADLLRKAEGINERRKAAEAELAAIKSSDLTPVDTQWRKVPVYDQPVSGGPNGELAVNYAQPITHEYISVEDWRESIRGYIVAGDCLAPIIEDGDTIFVDHDLIQPDDGDYVMCTHIDDFNDGKVGVKRYRHMQNQTWFEDKEIRYSAENCRVNGIVVEWHKKRRNHHRKNEG